MSDKNTIYKHICGWIGKKDELIHKWSDEQYTICPNCKIRITPEELVSTLETKKEPKPCKPNPQFYAIIFKSLQQIAHDLGYNLVLHGSLNRDMDLIAIPWVDNPKSHLELLNAFQNCLIPKNSKYLASTKNDFMFSMLPGGRSSYIINLNRGGKFNNYIDEQMYLDISITPLISI